MNEPLALIIEDEYDLADIFSEALHAAGYTTEIINHGEEALERLKVIVPNIIILDLHLPGVDGSILLQQIRDDQRLASSKVIVTTADHTMAGVLPRKPDMVLIKPISFSKLRDLSRHFKQMGD